MVTTTDVEGALQRLQIDYRKHRSRDDTLYFCSGPDRATFNMQLQGDGGLQLWRFLMTDLPGGCEGAACLREQAERSVGIEVTDENVLNFYTRPKIRSGAGRGLTEILSREVSGFLRMSASVQEKCKDLIRNLKEAI